MKKHQLNKSKLSRSLFGCLLLCTIIFVSCEKKYEYTDQIVGKWELKAMDGSKVEPGFTWMFNEDLTYTVVNNVGSYEKDPFKSTPFRAEGTFTGGYYVGAPKGMRIREKYRSSMSFSAVNILENKMTMKFYPVEDRGENESKDILVELERTE